MKQSAARRSFVRRASLISILAVTLALGISQLFGAGGETPLEISYPVYPPAPASQTQNQADAKSSGCVSCHVSTDQHTMHSNPAVVLGCTDCHGGDAMISAPQNHHAEVHQPTDPTGDHSEHKVDSGHASGEDDH
ncbi:MAG: hypothetical protein HKN85_03695, partial [Gammaproteobacteria bacterium]|nr:hypothetical protein [Gammaproteobacteria bacterium]